MADNADILSSFNTPSGFHFSGVDLDHLGASEYTLVGIACDASSSVISFASQIEGCLKISLEGCLSSPRKDNLLVRLTRFNQNVHQVHGFTKLVQCPISTYDGFLKPGGTTALRDATIDMADALATYGKELQENEYTANGLLVIISDGIDCGSKRSAQEAAMAINRALSSESLESLVSVLIGINVDDPDVSTTLKEFQAQAGIGRYLEAKDASPKTFAKIAGFITQSISSQSQAINSGTASVPITW